MLMSVACKSLHYSSFITTHILTHSGTTDSSRFTSSASSNPDLFFVCAKAGRQAVKKIGRQVTGIPRPVNNTCYGTVMVVGFGVVRRGDLLDPSPRRHHFFFFSLSSSERISWISERFSHYVWVQLYILRYGSSVFYFSFSGIYIFQMQSTMQGL